MPLTAEGTPMSTAFRPLTVTAIRAEGPDAVCLTLAPDTADAGAFAFRPGQYLTLRADIDGADLRRAYSICSAPGAPLSVGVKRVEGGRFSGFATGALKVGDRVEALTPEGRFGPAAIGGAHDYLLIGAGSGVTPLLSIATAVLEGEPESRVTLVYGNRGADTIMFREALEDLKDRFLGRLTLIHILSRETQDSALFHGRIDGARIAALARAGLIDPGRCDAAYLCGPGAMVEDASAALVALGLSPDRIGHELFTPASDAVIAPPSPRASAAAQTGATVEVTLDGARRSFSLTGGTVLDAAHEAGLELPWSCANGMCCTCRCKVTSGEAEMAQNWSLEPWEIEAGFILACQARPLTDRLALDFDAV
jgi:ring-1,2-phenylacetyl-CoA epoxidase subunit PaaE